MSRTDARPLPLTRTGAALRVVFAALLPLPIILLAWSAWPGSGAAFLDAWRVFDRIALQRLAGSFHLAIWTVFFAAILAIPVYTAYLSASPRMQRRLVLLSMLPLSFPPFGVSSGWLILISRLEQSDTGRLLFEQRGTVSQWLYSQAGGGWLLALCFWPIVFLAFVLSGQPRRSQIEAARLFMTRWTSIRRILWPALREPFLMAAAIIVCLCLLQFEVPSLLQLPSYPLEIYTRFSIPENEWKALLLCFPYTLTAGLLAWALRRAGRFIDESGNDPPYTIASSPIRPIAFSLTLVVFVLSAMIPLAALILHAGSFPFTISTIASHGDRLFRSVLYAGGSALAVVLLGIAYASRISLRRGLFGPAIFTALFTCPGILIASGWLQLRSFWPGVLPPAGAVLSIGGAFVTHRMLVGYIVGVLLWRAYGERQREYEMLLPIGRWARFRRLYIPALIRPASFGVIVTALLLWGDVAITILLHPPGGDSLAVEYFNLLHYGSDARTAAIGFLLLLAPAAIVSMAWMISAWGSQAKKSQE